MTDQVQGYPAATTDHSFATLCHLLGLAWLTPIPFGNVIAPLVLWLWKRDTNPEVDLHGKEAINFQLSMSIYTLVAAFSIFLVIGIFLLPAVLITNLALTVIATVKASRGEFYHYPLTIRLIN